MYPNRSPLAYLRQPAAALALLLGAITLAPAADLSRDEVAAITRHDCKPCRPLAGRDLRGLDLSDLISVAPTCMARTSPGPACSDRDSCAPT